MVGFTGETRRRSIAMGGNLSDPIEKLRWADRHLALLRQLGKPFRGSLIAHADADGLGYSFYPKWRK